MHINEARKLVQTIKEAIRVANNKADYKRVQQLKLKRTLLRQKIHKCASS